MRAPRLRGTITTILMILIAVMIVRDILARRWGSPHAAILRRDTAHSLS